MNIVTNSSIPDSTYFTISQISPEVEKNKLTVYDGSGTRRSWGAPAVTSSVVVNTATFTCVHVGFHHKHRGGQGWFYFVGGRRLTWAQLDTRRRKQVLAGIKNAPRWAKTPGNL